MLLFANSLDGVRGGLVSGIQPAMGGLEGISRVGRTLGTPDAHPNLKEEPLWGQPPAAVRRSAAPLTVHYSCPPLKKTSMEDGRPSPSRFEHWRASKFPSRHPEPRRGRLVRPAERSSATHGIDRHPERASFAKARLRTSNLEEEPLGTAAFSYPPTNRRNPFSKARKIRRDHPNH